MNELKVGLLTLFALASLGVISIKLTQNQTGFGSYVEYRAYLKDASGIYPRTTIKVAGINSGRIKDISLDGKQALVTFEVLESVPLRENALIKIKTVGFLGDKFIDLDPGEGNRLPAGTVINSGAGGGLEDLAKDASDVLADVKIIVKNLKESMFDEQRQNIIQKIVRNFRDVSEDAKSISKSIRNITTGNESSLHKIVSNFEKMSESLAFETDKYADGSVMSEFEKLGPIMSDAKTAVADLKVIIGDVKAGKGTIGRLMRDDEVVDQVSETLSNVNRLVNRINNIEADIALFTGVNSDNGNHTQFDVDIFPAPERFFRLGFAKNDFGPDAGVETNTTTTTGGTTTTQNKRVVEKDKLKFNLMIGRVVQRFGLRAGLIESTGGLGIDYFFPDYGSRISMDIFDYREDIGPNVRLTMELRMWNVFYARLAGEDLVSKADEQTITLSAGLRFTDQDLTALLGAFVN